MPFSTYKTISAVLKEFQVTYIEANLIIEAEFNISDYFREDLEIVMQDGAVNYSEFAICENLIYPVLKEVWKQYRHNFSKRSRSGKRKQNTPQWNSSNFQVNRQITAGRIALSAALLVGSTPTVVTNNLIKLAAGIFSFCIWGFDCN